ncbi:hypothetical protein LCGC14_0630390 [marine sediment metagenome]|uniref:Uncharacterized protein n=1 Tax=marine sediment metagenome TaxID=412755 RepID=A0A0F9R233_9ZZZZ
MQNFSKDEILAVAGFPRRGKFGLFPVSMGLALLLPDPCVPGGKIYMEFPHVERTRHVKVICWVIVSCS